MGGGKEERGKMNMSKKGGERYERKEERNSFLLPLLHTYRTSYHLQWWAVVRRLWWGDTKCGPGSTHGGLWKVSGRRKKRGRERGRKGGREERERREGRERGEGGIQCSQAPLSFCYSRRSKDMASLRVFSSPSSVENEAHCDFVKLREMLLR